MEVERVKFTEVFRLDGKIHEQGEVSFPKSWLQNALISEYRKDGRFYIRFEGKRTFDTPQDRHVGEFLWVKEDPRPFLEQK